MVNFEIETNKREFSQYLLDRGLLDAGESVLSATKPGAGNMNVVIRLQTEERSLILKQSRPFVQKYPQIPAPLSRIRVEYLFYQAIASCAGLAEAMPQILHYDVSNHLLIMEDLGTVQDYTSIYQQDVDLARNKLEKLVCFLSELHKISPKDLEVFPDNLALRKLNHEHIFMYPFMPNNGFDLDQVTPGLEALSDKFRADISLIPIVQKMGGLYLSSGNHLLHGDFYPGSWIEKEGQPMILDPEFAFVGLAEFDLGVMYAHLLMGGTSETTIDLELRSYAGKLDHTLMQAFCGIEIFRRIMGLAQLPLDYNLEEKEQLLNKARSLVLN